MCYNSMGCLLSMVTITVTLNNYDSGSYVAPIVSLISIVISIVIPKLNGSVTQP